MRIALNTFALSSRLGMAGAGRYVLELARALAGLDHGHELVLMGNADNRALLPTRGCHFVDCGRLTTVRPLRLVWEQTVLPLWLRRHHVDLLHSPVFVAPLLAPCASVVTILDMTWFALPGQHTRVKGAYFRAMIPPSAGRAAHILTISEATKRDVVALLGTAEEKVTAIPLGVDLAAFFPQAGAGRAEALKDHYGISQPYVLYVGKLEPRKNLPVLIEAFFAIAAGFPNHQLVIAGNPGWDYQAIYGTAARSPVSRRVHFPGFIAETDLPALYAAADLFVYPSSYEGFGFPVLEAMACGTPVITSNVSSLPEVAGEAALLVDPLDSAALAAAMRQALADPTMRQELRARGLEQARHFTWEETARRTLRAYEKTPGK
jgi:glycosyltransferase involved in cell wall biosynthesis